MLFHHGFGCSTRHYIGTPGCGKSTGLIQEIVRQCLANPGALGLVARWTEREADTVLRGDFFKECPPEIIKDWVDRESRLYLINGSSIYIHGLKPAEGQDRYGKFAGYNLSIIGLSQVEAFPRDVVEKLQSDRLRNRVGPRWMLTEGNIPGRDHWLAELMVGQQKADRCWVKDSTLLVIGNLKDNALNLPDDFVIRQETSFPPGHPLRGTQVEGRFGAGLRGEPVYGPIYSPEIHDITDEPDPAFPMLLSFDFGPHRPGVAWGQIQPGPRLRIFGEYMGKNQKLADVIQEVKRLHNLWFPQCKGLKLTCDPSGTQINDLGRTPAQFLQAAFTSYPLAVRKDGNRPEVREYAIQTVADMMLRRTMYGQAFGVHTRCSIIRDALAAGYMRPPVGPTPTIAGRLPIKDGYYDHLMNALEYLVVTFYGATFPTEETMLRPIEFLHWLGA